MKLTKEQAANACMAGLYFMTYHGDEEKKYVEELYEVGLTVGDFVQATMSHRGPEFMQENLMEAIRALRDFVEGGEA